MSEGLKLRYELALARLREIAEGADEVREPFADFFRAAARFLLLLDQSRDRAVHTKEENAALYRDVLPENYEKSYLNPTRAAAELGRNAYGFECNKEYFVKAKETMLKGFVC